MLHTDAATDDFYALPFPNDAARARRRHRRSRSLRARRRASSTTTSRPSTPARRTSRTPASSSASTAPIDDGDAAGRLRRIARGGRHRVRSSTSRPARRLRPAHAGQDALHRAQLRLHRAQLDRGAARAGLPVPRGPRHRRARHRRRQGRRRQLDRARADPRRRAVERDVIGRRSRARANGVRAAARLARRARRRRQARRRRHLLRIGERRRRSWPTCAPPCTRRRPRRRSPGSSEDGEDDGAVDDIFEGTYQGPNSSRAIRPTRRRAAHITNRADACQARMETLRIAMTIPKGDPPAAGWPVVIYQHGTGGDYKSFIGDGSGREVAKVTDAGGSGHRQDGDDRHRPGAARHALARRHRRRDSRSSTSSTSGAAHDNPKQGALDAFQRRALDSRRSTSPPRRRRASRIKFDTEQDLLQGSLAGRPHRSAVPRGRAGGEGGGAVGRRRRAHLLAAQQDRAGQHPARSCRRCLHDPPIEFHPLLSLIQGYFEDTDPVNYGAPHLRRAAGGPSRRRASSRRSASSTTTRRSRTSRRWRSAWACSRPDHSSMKIDGLVVHHARSGATRRSRATSLVGRPPACCSSIRLPRDTTATSWFSTFLRRLPSRIASLRPTPRPVPPASTAP